MRDPFNTEAVGFDDPLAMLHACHERVRHYAGLLPRLAAHVTEHGVDAQAVEAARAILRYFDVAAPLHHADEDDDLFALLAGRLQGEPLRVLRELQVEHDVLGVQWQHWRGLLMSLIQGHGAVLNEVSAMAFAQQYIAHADREETHVYPWAETLVRPDELVKMGRRMAARRMPATD
ncbi:hemerythrin domain-containing protein [Chitiniphilus eburneus]|uniref:Hemerythrin domain-containing protein n=1 Tax=Chitiniphilus eburneus TaxID=2571148 RepID=A0A4V5MS87_9NEIS|nr:hemerythrin domain-containing protein [Chitiniphilus eburneus]TJZ79148.1 hemerythrin domain-containing protein [Chitiniphilus eburneus]